MKKISLLFAMLILAFAAYSQDTIFAAENSFNVGDTINFFKVFGADQFDPGDNGLNVVWDYHTLYEDGTNNLFQYVDPSGKPHIDIMPDVDVAEKINTDLSYMYYDNQSGTQWNRSGFYSNDGNGTEIWLGYSEPLQLYPDTMLYQDQYSVTGFSASGGYTSSGITDDAAIPAGNSSYTFDYDGYGVLILPQKIYLNAMKVHGTENFEIDLYYSGNPLMTQHVDDEFYFWYVKGIKSYVLYYDHTHASKDDSYTLQWQKPYDTLLADFVATDTDSYNIKTIGTTDDAFRMVNLSYPLNNGSTFQWQFTPNNVEYLNGTSATDSSVNVRFTQPGDYTVTQTITNSNFSPDSKTITKTEYIHIDAAPQLVVDFSADNTILDVNGTANFTSDVSVSTGETVQGTTTYHWAVSPGSDGNQWGFTNFTSDTSKNPSIQFYQAGCYSIQLIATNDTYSNSPVTVTKMNYINVGGGCGNSYTVTFNVTDENSNPVPNAQITVSGYSPITTDANGQASISLYNGNYNYTVTADTYQDYSGSFTVSDADQTIDVTLTALPASINDLSNANISIYPNPNTGTFTVKSPENVDITIFDITGKTVYQNTNIKEANIDLSKNQKGLYIIQLKNNKISVNSKIIIK